MAPVPGGPAASLALIFDMDGVMIDSNPEHRRAWEIFNRRYGLVTTDEMHQRMYGKRNDEIVRDFFGELDDGETAARGAAKETLYRERIGGRLESLLTPGLREFLERHAGSPMAVASNAEPANIDFLLDRAGLRRWFRVVVDGSQVRHPKPDPEIYLRAAQLLEAPAEACVVFEDSYAGVAAGRAAGMKVVGVLSTHAELPGTDFAIDNFLNGELEAWLSAQAPGK